MKNELLKILSNAIENDILKEIAPQIDILFGEYEIIKKAKTDSITTNEIDDLLEYYMISRKIAGLKDSTLSQYDLVLRDFFKTTDKHPENIESIDIKKYLFEYQKNTGISDRTLSMKQTIVCGYFNWLASEGLIPHNPGATLKPIRYERKHKKPMTQMELEKVRLACKTKREKAIVEVLYSTGCRVSELENLNISDVNFETKEVQLFGKGAKYRKGFINAKAEVALKEYLNSRNDSNEALFVFDKKPHGRLHKSGIEKIIKGLTDRATDVETHITPHIFRHTTANIALDRGMSVLEVSKLLGHKNIETTMEYILSDMNTVKNKHQHCIV